MNTILADERPLMGGSSSEAVRDRGTQVCDPQLTPTQLVGDIFKDLRSKHAVLQLIKLSVIMMLVPWLLWLLVKPRLDWDIDMWAKASLFAVNIVLGIYVLLAWKDDQEERHEQEEESKKDK